MGPQDFAAVMASADLFVNVSERVLREAYAKCPRKIFIDTDPGRNHYLEFPAP
jgi:hypothetical protein